MTEEKVFFAKDLVMYMTMNELNSLKSNYLYSLLLNYNPCLGYFSNDPIIIR